MHGPKEGPLLNFRCLYIVKDCIVIPRRKNVAYLTMHLSIPAALYNQEEARELMKVKILSNEETLGRLRIGFLFQSQRDVNIIAHYSYSFHSSTSENLSVIKCIIF